MECCSLYGGYTGHVGISLFPFALHFSAKTHIVPEHQSLDAITLIHSIHDASAPIRCGCIIKCFFSIPCASAPVKHASSLTKYLQMWLIGSCVLDIQTHFYLSPVSLLTITREDCCSKGYWNVVYFLASIWCLGGRLTNDVVWCMWFSFFFIKQDAEQWLLVMQSLGSWTPGIIVKWPVFPPHTLQHSTPSLSRWDLPWTLQFDVSWSGFCSVSGSRGCGTCLLRYLWDSFYFNPHIIHADYHPIWEFILWCENYPTWGTWHTILWLVHIRLNFDLINMMSKDRLESAKPKSDLS